MDAHQEIITAAEQAITRQGLLENPYLVGLHDGSLDRAQFLRSQEQFFYAVEFFTRPMAGLIARIPDPQGRLNILQNVVEEHGEFDRTRFHATTFQAFLRSLDADVEGLEALELWPEVRAFNACLAAVCVHDQLEVGLACMGVIEYAFADISASIGRGVVARDWIQESELVHYRLHAEIDKRHAGDFFVSLEDAWAVDEQRYFVRQGLELGAYIFDRLYRDLARHPLD